MKNYVKLKNSLSPEQQVELEKCKDIWVEPDAEFVKCNDILAEGFVWSNSPQGFKYWHDVHEDLFEKGL